MALVMVTGARGAIGRHVVARALLRGHRVSGLGHGAWSAQSGLPAIDAWINGGVDGDNLAALARQAGPPEIVIHLAGGSLVGASVAHPGEDFRRTVETSQRLLEWLRNEAPAARLVIASSAAVYGDGHASPIAEQAAFAPTSPYGTHKAMMEMLCGSYCRQYGLKAAVLRLFSVYGPGLGKQLVWDLASRMAAGERTIELGGTGSEQRDFLFIEDAADMLLDAASLTSETPPVLNGCSGTATAISEVAALVASQFGSVRFTFNGRNRPGDPRYLVGDAAKSRAAGLTAPVGLAEGIERTVGWVKGAWGVGRLPHVAGT